MSAARNKPKLTAQMIEWAAEQREEHGCTVASIAARLDVSSSALAWHLLRVGADRNDLAARELPQTAPGPLVVMRNGHAVRHFTPAEDAMLQLMAAAGAQYTQIGKACDPPRKHNSIKARLMILARHDARREAAADRRLAAAQAPVGAAQARRADVW